MYRAAFSRHRHLLNLTRQLHAPGERAPLSRYQFPTMLGGPQTRWGRNGEVKVLDPDGNQTQIPRSSSHSPYGLPYSSCILKLRRHIHLYIVYLMRLAGAQSVFRRTVGWTVAYELGSIWKELVVAWFEAMTQMWERSHKGYSVCRPRFEPVTKRIRDRNLIFWPSLLGDFDVQNISLVYNMTPFITVIIDLSLRVTTLQLCRIWGFHGGDYEECRLLGCYAVWPL
jgi:hypothetical protein